MGSPKIPTPAILVSYKDTYFKLDSNILLAFMNTRICLLFLRLLSYRFNELHGIWISGGLMPHSQGLSNNPYPEQNQPIHSNIVLQPTSRSSSC